MNDGEGKQSVHTLVENVASRYADKAALKDRQGSITYRELLEKSREISAYLENQSIKEKDIILLLFDQGKEAVAGMLGVLGLGGTYVPVEPAEPAERLKRIVADCDIRFFLTDTTNFDKARSLLNEIPGIAVEEIPDPGSDFIGRSIPSDSIAYIIYTSGSTGLPKGIRQTHENLVHFANTYTDSLGIDSNDRLSMLYSLNFGASNMDIYGGLLRGASVHFFDFKNHGLSGLHDWLDREQITILHTVPSVFRRLVANTPEGFTYHHIRGIDLGGEAVYAQDAGLLDKYFRPDCICLNHFAATEASVIAQHRITPGQASDVGVIPLGKPARDMEVEIIREDGAMAGCGEPGVIVLKSPFISPGYHNRPELNEKAFFKDKESGIPCFRTGDLGYFDSDGLLHYRGRNDFRININGITVETGEIESALSRVEGISDAVVLAEESENKPARLIGFVIFEEGTVLTDGQIRKDLSQWLPLGLMPNEIIALKRFPVTSTGKVDRKQLGLYAPSRSSGSHS